MYKEITIRELSKPNAKYLMDSLLPNNDISEKLRNQILQKADGNPFFLEEILRSLIDNKIIYEDNGRWFSMSDVDNLAVPDTIQVVIMNRVTTLDESLKNILRYASVMGNSLNMTYKHVVQDEPKS